MESIFVAEVNIVVYTENEKYEHGTLVLGAFTTEEKAKEYFHKWASALGYDHNEMLDIYHKYDDTGRETVMLCVLNVPIDRT